MKKMQKAGILLLVLVLALTACTSFADTGERGTTMNNIDGRQQTEFRYNRFADLFYYLLAHMPIDYAADVSDPGYTAEMAGCLGVYPGIPQRLINYYQDNFDRLAVINFMSLAAENPGQFREMLAGCGMLTDKDMTYFVDPLIEICDRVSGTFYQWWKDHHTETAQQAEKVYNRFRALTDRFSSFFADLGMDTQVLFSYSLRKNGRAFNQQNTLVVYLTYPEKPEDITHCFLQFLHECTHSVTDPMMDGEIRMDDGSHDIAEYQVLCFDEYLIEALCPDLSGAYRDWIGEENLEVSRKMLGETGENRLKERLKQMIQGGTI